MQDKGQDTSSFMVLLWTGWADGKSELCTADASFVGCFFISFLFFWGQQFVFTDIPFYGFIWGSSVAAFLQGQKDLVFD